VSTSEEPVTDLIYGLEVRRPLRVTVFVALQHVFAVFVGMITPPLLIAGALKLGSADTAYLVSMSLFVSGAATILQTSRLGPIGSGLLSIQGTSFTFIAPIISVAGSAMAAGATAAQALGGIFGLCMAGASVVLVASRFIQRASTVITPVVTGTVVTLIGLTLIEVGMVSVGGGYGARADGSFGSLQNLGNTGRALYYRVRRQQRRPGSAQRRLSEAWADRGARGGELLGAFTGLSLNRGQRARA
jgi:xanthine permease XanP